MNFKEFGLIVFSFLYLCKYLSDIKVDDFYMNKGFFFIR